jgi:hypothetical protein
MLVYFIAIWYILWPFGIFSRFGMMYKEKSCNPGTESDCILPMSDYFRHEGHSEDGEELRVEWVPRQPPFLRYTKHLENKPTTFVHTYVHVPARLLSPLLSITYVHIHSVVRKRVSSSRQAKEEEREAVVG